MQKLKWKPRWRSLWAVGFLSAVAAQAGEIRIVYTGPQESSAFRGAQQGLSEANILGRFTGQSYRLEAVEPGQLNLQPAGDPPLAILAAANSETLLQLAQSFPGVLVFNLTLEDDALRRHCRPNLLHVIPSAKMKADALAQWRQQHGDGSVQAQAWHHEFVKFAARELNNRFRKGQGVPMDDEAWAGWAAVKMVSEGVARTQSAEANEILRYLREEMEFDGQKGAPHTFRETGQLRQPLLIVKDGRPIAEAPVRGAADPDDLDSLGLQSCKQDETKTNY